MLYTHVHGTTKLPLPFGRHSARPFLWGILSHSIERCTWSMSHCLSLDGLGDNSPGPERSRGGLPWDKESRKHQNTPNMTQASAPDSVIEPILLAFFLRGLPTEKWPDNVCWVYLYCLGEDGTLGLRVELRSDCHWIELKLTLQDSVAVANFTTSRAPALQMRACGLVASLTLLETWHACPINQKNMTASLSSAKIMTFQTL